MNEEYYLNFLRKYILEELKASNFLLITPTNIHKYLILKLKEIIYECENKNCKKTGCFNTVDNIGRPINGSQNLVPENCVLDNLKIIDKSKKFVSALREKFGTIGSVKTLKDILIKIEPKTNLNNCKSISNFISQKTTPYENNYKVLIPNLFFAPTFDEWIKFKNKEDFKINEKQNHSEQKKVEYVAEISNNSKIIIEKDKNKIKKIKKNIFFSSGLLLIFILIIFGSNQKEKINAQENIFNTKLLKSIDKYSYNRIYMGDTFSDSNSNVINNNIFTNNNNVADNKLVKSLVFSTYSLQNKYYISSSENWNFKTDPNGEDISSKIYGFDNVQECFSTTGTQNIAHDYLTIRFYVTNNSDSIYTITGVALNVINTFNFNAEILNYGCYSEERDLRKNILLDENEIDYSFDINVVEIKPKENKWFIITVLAPEKLSQNTIFNFNFKIEYANTILKTRNIIYSDKTYFLSASR